MSVAISMSETACGFTPAPGHHLSERYYLLRQIGRGAQGCVYLAFDSHLERPVAIKIALAECQMSSTERTSRFQQEMQLIGRLTHPNIVKLLDFGSYRQRPYFVMELHPGPTLARRLRDGPIGFFEACVLLDELLAAVEYIHEMGLVHRDIKPHNVLLADGERAVLADFGLARSSLDPRFTLAGMLVGTPYYTAPEVFVGVRDQPASDLWSVGVVAYELFSGNPPFVAETLRALVTLVLTIDPVPIRERCPDTPPALSKWIARMLAKDPLERFPTARAARSALRAAV
jgi:serine/threonine protein kinase